jgi:hypothetical protein
MHHGPDQCKTVTVVDGDEILTFEKEGREYRAYFHFAAVRNRIAHGLPPYDYCLLPYEVAIGVQEKLMAWAKAEGKWKPEYQRVFPKEKDK